MSYDLMRHRKTMHHAFCQRNDIDRGEIWWCIKISALVMVMVVVAGGCRWFLLFFVVCFLSLLQYAIVVAVAAVAVSVRWSNLLQITGQSYFGVSISWVFVGIRGYPLALVAQITGYPSFSVSIPCFRGYPGVSVPVGLPRSQKLLPKSGGRVGYSWSCKSQGNLTVGFSRQITCKSQGILPLVFQVPVFSWVSGGIRSCLFAKIAKATSEKRRLRWVFTGIRRYPLVLVVKSLADHRVILLVVLNFLGFHGYPAVSVGFGPQK